MSLLHTSVRSTQVKTLKISKCVYKLLGISSELGVKSQIS